ncbi:MAG: hypothetical protein IJX26_00645, partial [Clostridia bacterium]|nr:hypothetical protein [Clostridia bacterium]
MEKSKYVKLVSGKITGNSHVSISRVEGKSFTLKIAEGEKDFVDIELLNEIKSQIDNPTQQYNPQFISVTPLSSYAKDGRKYMKIKISSDSTRIYLHFVDYSLAKKVYELFNEKVLEIE